MSIATVLTQGLGNGTFTSSPELLLLRGYGIGEAVEEPEAEVAPTPITTSGQGSGAGAELQPFTTASTAHVIDPEPLRAVFLARVETLVEPHRVILTPEPVVASLSATVTLTTAAELLARAVAVRFQARPLPVYTESWMLATQRRLDGITLQLRHLEDAALLQSGLTLAEAVPLVDAVDRIRRDVRWVQGRMPEEERNE